MENKSVSMSVTPDDINTLNRECNEPSLEDDDEDEQITFLNLPIEIRQEIYVHLRCDDFVRLRLVCNQLRLESEWYGKFCIKVTDENLHLQDIEIPFPHLHLLIIDNDKVDLPWGDSINDSIKYLLLQNVSFKTLIQLGKLRSVEDSTFTSLVFQRPIPPLSWTCLQSLQIVFHVPEHEIERFMLENLDTLFQQQFEMLQNFRISLMNPYAPNIQSKYSIPVARFVAKHWKSLKSLEIEFEGETCTEEDFEHIDLANNNDDGGELEILSTCSSFSYSQPTITLQLSSEELENFLKVRLQNLEMRITEASCPRCSIWADFLRQQTHLKCLLLNILDTGDISSNFFCNHGLNQFEHLSVLSLKFWGVEQDYFPFDFKYLVSAKQLTYFELTRSYDKDNNNSLGISELLNIECIPETVDTLVLDGLHIESAQIRQILHKLTTLKYFSLLNCGTGRDFGVNSTHCPDFKSLKKLITFLVDFNPDSLSESPTQSLYNLKSKLASEFSGGKWLRKHFCQASSSSEHFDEFNCYHRFLFAKDKICIDDGCNPGLNIYNTLAKPPPRHYNEEETSYFYTMKDLILTTRFSAMLYELMNLRQSQLPRTL